LRRRTTGGKIGPRFLDVNPRTLRLPPTRRDGADPIKLQRQIAKHGKSVAGMPPLWVNRGTDGELMVMDGVTRATRVAKLLPGTLVPVDVVAEVKKAFGGYPSVQKLP
jgi:hypothetical protein